MTNVEWSFLILYLTVAAGYGGWRGGDLWLGWGVWCLWLPPIAWAALKIAGEWRRNPYWGTIRIALVMMAIGVACLGGTVLSLAWVVAEATERWSAVPALRAIVGVGMGAAAGGLAWLYAKSRQPAELREGREPDSSGGPAEPGASPEPAGR
jgi:hypothetical protein